VLIFSHVVKHILCKTRVKFCRIFCVHCFLRPYNEKGEKTYEFGPISKFYIKFFYIEQILGLLFMNLNKVNAKKQKYKLT
jgi:hypothetical protein